MSTAVLRVKRALALAQLDAPANLERITGAANEVWYAGDYVVRISSHPGTRRLEHEANVAKLLPPGVRYPGIVSYGRAEFGEWLVMRNVQRHGARSGVGDDARGRAPRRGVPARRGASRGPPDQGRREQRGARPAAVPRARQPRVPAPASARSPAPRARAGAHVAQRRQGRARPGRAARPHQRRVAQRARRPRRSCTAICTSRTCSTTRARSPRCSTSSSLAPGLPTSTSRSSCASAQTRSCTCRSTTRRPSTATTTAACSAGSTRRIPRCSRHPSLESRLNLYSLSYDLRDLVVDPPRKPFDQLPPFHAYRRLAPSSRRPRHVAADRVVSSPTSRRPRPLARPR